ncbi:putative endonuclease [Microbacterium endophyticum]|uniref:UPF0102 protein FHX49_000164 n=1 Tax=Microbacterium endophyticum TaxID=1526412 RepID=A0A7W4V0H4_9MICO|nr:YraN family protein [Microbacterium endophyticum]MBB2974623.1 putative endonuclease [Microbacterium endophyticum]NIK36920.1 putative endonuclease [Microbacterium endophyticum]
MAEKDELGRRGEERAATYLEGVGYRVLSRNWRGADGEVDLVVCHGSFLVFVEVKTRRTEAFGHPLEAVGPVKLRRLWRLSSQWCAAFPHIAAGHTVRIDAVGIIGPDPSCGTVEHLQDLR